MERKSRVDDDDKLQKLCRKINAMELLHIQITWSFLCGY
jgi:hypothetical protein